MSGNQIKGQSDLDLIRPSDAIFSSVGLRFFCKGLRNLQRFIMIFSGRQVKTENAMLQSIN
jgi:hypothetical protein